MFNTNKPQEVDVKATMKTTNMSDGKTNAVQDYINSALQAKKSLRSIQKTVFQKWKCKITFEIPPVQVIRKPLKTTENGDNK